MIRKVSLLTCLLVAMAGANAQETFFTKTGRITFFSSAPLEDIDATTKTAAAVLNVQTGALQFSVLLKSFGFKKALMQEHFNANYVESDTYPSSTFTGTVTNNSTINYTKPGVYNASVNGQLTLHGVTKNVTATGTIAVAAGTVHLVSEFNLSLSDYKIKRPPLVKNKVSNAIKITVDAPLQPLAK